MYPKAGRMRECPIPRSSDGTSGKFPPRSLKSQTKKYTFINDDDQNTNTSTKSENLKKNKSKEGDGNGNGKKQVVDEVPGQDRSGPSINDIVTDSDTDTDVIVTDNDTTDNNVTWKTYCMKCFTSRFHKVTIVLFALANILQYSFLQAINFEYVNAILFIHSVVCNWFLEDSIADLKGSESRMKAEMKAGMKVIENKLEAMGNKLEAEKSSSAASKVENEIRFTAIETELKQKVNKIGYQDTKIEKRDTKISNLEKENTNLQHDLYESNLENNRPRSKVKECCDCATEMAEKYDGANMTVIEREKTTTRGEAKTAMTEIIVEQSLVRYGLDVPRNKKDLHPLHLAADHIKRAKKKDNGNGPSIEDLRTFTKAFGGENDNRNKHAHTPSLIEIDAQVNSVYESVTKNDPASRQAMKRVTNIKNATTKRLVNSANRDFDFSTTKANRSFSLSNTKRTIASIMNTKKK